MARRCAASVLVALALLFAAPLAHAQPTPGLRVLAAASLTEVVGALARRFEGTLVVPSFGASSELARQIKDGAPADVFVSASPEWIDFLREKNALDGSAVVFARNELVCIAPHASGLAAKGGHDAATLLEKGRSEERRG